MRREEVFWDKVGTGAAIRGAQIALKAIEAARKENNMVTATITVPSTGEKKVITLITCSCGGLVEQSQVEFHEKNSYCHGN
jgi:hypothetical protein